MVKLLCVDRQRDKNGKIVKYILKDIDAGKYIEATPENVRLQLKNINVCIFNLKLSADNKILLVNNKFQNEVDETNKKYSNNKFVREDVEKYVDSLIEQIIDYGNKDTDSNKLIRFGGLNTSGDINTFSVCINNSVLGYENCILVMRYKKNIRPLGNNKYKSYISIEIVGIKTSTGHIRFSRSAAFRTKEIEFINGRAKDINIKDEYTKLLKYIAKHCDDECSKSSMHKAKKEELTKKLLKTGIRSVSAALIAASCIGLVGCGNTTYASTVEDTAIETVQSTKTYACDYKTFAFNTKITTNIGDKNVTIKGNIFRLVTDPLKMVDDDGNVLAEATDSYNFISEDDHAILVNGVVDVVMSGNFDFIGKSYKLYDKDGNHIGNFKRNKLTSMGAKITDIDGNIIAEYSRGLMMNDFEVTINENDKMSDEAVLMIMSSFVSDQKYEDSSNSSISFGDSD